MSVIVRRAKHAGSWYTHSDTELSNQLNSWLNETQFINGPARVLITPHAGYRYSGRCSAHAYKQISPEMVKRIFILGPSHHFSLSGCALTRSNKCQTPFYDLIVDTQTISDLYSTGKFEFLAMDVDEKEHSIEMQLPFVAKIMEKYLETCGNPFHSLFSSFKDSFTIVPILVGTLNLDSQNLYAKLLLTYLKDPGNVFIISSDFCHWGSNFRYTYYDNSFSYIYESIENLDKMGIDAIENLDPKEFQEYLQKYGNTICGRHVIGILLKMVQLFVDHTSLRPVMKFLNYSQSNKCLTTHDSSVSYASASLRIPQ